jgi:hypothetical protein
MTVAPGFQSTFASQKISKKKPKTIKKKIKNNETILRSHTRKTKK